MTDMFAPGATLRAAREKHNLTQADIAEATRIKAHIIEAIENNDFQQIATPLYAKGFIKMYAERVGLDPDPLIREYLARFANKVRPTLRAHPPPAPVEQAQAPVRSRTKAAPPVPAAGALLEAGRAAAARVASDLAVVSREAVLAVRMAWAVRRGAGGWRRRRGFGLPRVNDRLEEFPIGRYAAVGTAIVAIAILAGFAVVLLRGRGTSSRLVPVEVAAPVAPKAAPASAVRLRLAEEPPAPYLKPRKPAAP